MTNIKNKIQEIKLARMGPEYRFVAELFSNLVSYKSKSKLDHIYFLIDGVPVMVYDKNVKYMWCHYDIIWNPLLRMIQDKMNLDNPSNFEEIAEMRKILAHFALAYFDMKCETISMSHSFITSTWKNLKFKRVYSW